MAKEVEIELSEIQQGDLIRTIRTVGAVTHTIEGVAERQDSDGDWLSEDELITYHDNYEETYFRIQPELPAAPGTRVKFPSAADPSEDVFALKTYTEDRWYATFPDGSGTLIGHRTIESKDWTLVR